MKARTGAGAVAVLTLAVLPARADAPELLRALDEYLGNVQKTGTWSRLVVTYFGNDALAVLGRAKQ